MGGKYYIVSINGICSKYKSFKWGEKFYNTVPDVVNKKMYEMMLLANGNYNIKLLQQN